MGADYKHAYFQIIGGPITGTVPANAAGYVSPFGGDDLASTTRISIEIPYACILDHLNHRSFVAPGAGESYVLTLMVNGAPTLLQTTIAGAVATEDEDIVNQIQLAAGDTFSLRIETSLNAAVTYQRFSMRCKPV